MPDSEKKKIENYVYINGKRLDTYYNELRALIKENKKDEAREMAKALYEKIISVYQEDEKSKFVSLRNKFEENVYQFLLKPEKVLQIAPFDFVSMISIAPLSLRVLTTFATVEVFCPIATYMQITFLSF